MGPPWSELGMSPLTMEYLLSKYLPEYLGILPQGGSTFPLKYLITWGKLHFTWGSHFQNPISFNKNLHDH